MKIFIYILLSILFFGLGWVSSVVHSKNSKPKKDYPILVSTKWDMGTTPIYVKMDVDSLKGDTLWRDGSFIVCKNIKNIQFQ